MHFHHLKPWEHNLDFGLSFMGGPDALDQVVAESDVLSLHLHLNAETRHIINADRLAKMKPTAFLINIARGALVDEDALTKALVDGKLGGCGYRCLQSGAA